MLMALIRKGTQTLKIHDNSTRDIGVKKQNNQHCAAQIKCVLPTVSTFCGTHVVDLTNLTGTTHIVQVQICQEPGTDKLQEPQLCCA